MSRTLIQEYATSLTRGFSDRAVALRKLGHGVTKGELRELFVSGILKLFLTNQFGVGSGIVINQEGQQSSQTDVIIYDNRILPPLIGEGHIGVYPAECVLATIEIKSNMTTEKLLKADEAAKRLYEVVYNPEDSIYDDYRLLPKPLTACFGFHGSLPRDLTNPDKGKDWLSDHITTLIGICLLNRYSWITVQNEWRSGFYDKETNAETKRFFAVLLDNIRTISEVRLRFMANQHRDWLGLYIRN